MATLDSIRKSLLEIELQPIKDGIRGESIALIHFEAIDQPFIHVHQEDWSKPQKLVAINGKRPDFYLLPLDVNFIMVDVKYHSIGVDERFTLEHDEIEKYKNLIDYTVNTQKIAREKIQLKLFIIPKEHNGQSYIVIDFHEYLSDTHLHDINIKYDNKIHKVRYVDLKNKLTKIMTISEPY